MAPDTARIETEQCEQMLHGSGCFALGKIARAITQHYDRVLAPVGIRVTDLGILRLCGPGGPISAAQLARDLTTNRPTIVRSLKPLIAAGMVERVTMVDGRKGIFVALTPCGRFALAEAVVKWEQAQRDLIEQIGEARWYRLRAELAALAGLEFNPA